MNEPQEQILKEILKELKRIREMIEDKFILSKEKVKEEPNDSDLTKDDLDYKPQSILD